MWKHIKIEKPNIGSSVIIRTIDNILISAIVLKNSVGQIIFMTKSGASIIENNVTYWKYQEDNIASPKKCKRCGLGR